MKIEKLKIKNLHKLYNYYVEFNPDLTFLYGTNGCGKTTILNIIEAFVSGRLYELFAWDFEYINLDYYDDRNLVKYKQTIYAAYDSDNLHVNWKTDTIVIKREEFIRVFENAGSYEEIAYMMEGKYPIFRSIRNEFNYIYLPLNRNSTINLKNNLLAKYPRLARRRFFYEEYDGIYSTREERIGKTTDLVQRKFTEVNARVAAINDEFRNKVLRSLLSANTTYSNDDFIDFLIHSVKSINVDSLRDQYLRLLDSLSLLDEAEKEKCEKFFNEYKKTVQDFSTMPQKPGSIPFSFSLLADYHEIEKMRTVIPLAQEMEEKKAQALARINLFQDIMNAFLEENNEDKYLFLDKTGIIKFKIEGTKSVSITTANLSSGEKQLLIFFANLVFGVDNNNPSIFVADEPELSLHLSWQKQFVEKAIQTNKNMQLIFATHAPEIVGKFRNKMFKLEKKVNL